MTILNHWSQKERDFLNLLVRTVQRLTVLADHSQFRPQVIQLLPKAANTDHIGVLCHQMQHLRAAARYQDWWVGLLDTQGGSGRARELVIGAIKRFIFA